MVEEHFGIAPAELQRAGCVTFVHNSGGQVEIVGSDTRLTFGSVDDAAERITGVIENPVLEQELRGQAAERKNWFSTETFCGCARSGNSVRAEKREECRRVSAYWAPPWRKLTGWVPQFFLSGGLWLLLSCWRASRLGQRTVAAGSGFSVLR
jgi:hypothetical protein